MPTYDYDLIIIGGGIGGSALAAAGDNPLPFWDSYQGADRSGHRDLARTTRVKEPALACYHPALQTALLNHTESRGTEIRRTAP